MKVRATVVLTFQAKTLGDAGAVMDDVLTRARERDDIEVGGVEIVSPPGEHAVTLPAPVLASGFGPPSPSTPVTNGG